VVAAPEVLETLHRHRWPGNIRELANVIEHALVLGDELPLTVQDLPARLGVLAPRGAAPAVAPASAAATAAVGAAVAAPGQRRPETLRELELRAILEGLERNQGNKPRTAEELGISLKTLYNKLQQLNEASPAA
jgi:two-component system NtrC family response regulator